MQPWGACPACTVPLALAFPHLSARCPLLPAARWGRCAQPHRQPPLPLPLPLLPLLANWHATAACCQGWPSCHGLPAAWTAGEARRRAAAWGSPHLLPPLPPPLLLHAAAPGPPTAAPPTAAPAAPAPLPALPLLPRRPLPAAAPSAAHPAAPGTAAGQLPPAAAPHRLHWRPQQLSALLPRLQLAAMPAAPPLAAARLLPLPLAALPHGAAAAAAAPSPAPSAAAAPRLLPSTQSACKGWRAAGQQLQCVNHRRCCPNCVACTGAHLVPTSRVRT